MFNVAMGSYEGAETCELIGTYMLSLITANFKDQVEPDSTVTTGLPREIEKIKQQVSNHVFKCKNRASSELLYKSNRAHFPWVYRGNNALGIFGRTPEKFVNHSPAARDLQTFIVFSPNIPRGLLPL